MTDENFFYVRNTASGVTIAQTAEEAAHILAHPHLKKFHVIVDSPKDEVLSQPYWIDDDGNRHPIEGADPIQLPVEDEAEEPELDDETDDIDEDTE